MPHRLPPDEMEYTTLSQVLKEVSSMPLDDYEKDREGALKALMARTGSTG